MKEQTLLGNIFEDIINLNHLLTPVAIEHLRIIYSANSRKSYRIIYIFGIRVAYYSTVKF